MKSLIVFLLMSVVCYADFSPNSYEVLYFRQKESLTMTSRCFGQDPADEWYSGYGNVLFPFMDETYDIIASWGGAMVYYPNQDLNSFDGWVNSCRETAPVFLRDYNLNSALRVEIYFPQCSLYWSVDRMDLDFTTGLWQANQLYSYPTATYMTYKPGGTGNSYFSASRLDGNVYFTPDEDIIDVTAFPNLRADLGADEWFYRAIPPFYLFVKPHDLTIGSESYQVPYDVTNNQVNFCLVYNYFFKIGDTCSPELPFVPGSGTQSTTFTPLVYESHDIFSETLKSGHFLVYKFTVDMGDELVERDHMFSTVMSAFDDLQTAGESTEPDIDELQNAIQEAMSNAFITSNGIIDTMIDRMNPDREFDVLEIDTSGTTVAESNLIEFEPREYSQLRETMTGTLTSMNNGAGAGYPTLSIPLSRVNSNFSDVTLDYSTAASHMADSTKYAFLKDLVTTTILLSLAWLSAKFTLWSFDFMKWNM